MKDKIEAIVLNPMWFVMAVAMIVTGTSLNITWLTLLGGIVFSCPICFMIWNYKRK